MYGFTKERRPGQGKRMKGYPNKFLFLVNTSTNPTQNPSSFHLHSKLKFNDVLIHLCCFHHAGILALLVAWAFSVPCQPSYVSACVHVFVEIYVSGRSSPIRPCFAKSYLKNVRLARRIKWWPFGEVYSSAGGFCCLIAVSLVLIGYVSGVTVDTETVPRYDDFIYDHVPVHHL